MRGDSDTDHPARVSDVTLKIPRPLYDRLSQVIEGTGFRSVTEFCVFVLRDLVSEPSVPAADPDRLSRDEVEIVRKRLRSLGYLE
jgi:hypothetical protein